MINEENIMLPTDLSFITPKISEVRLLLKMNQKDFGTKLGLNPRTISYLENGQRNITLTIVCNLVLKLKVNPYWLLWDEFKNTKSNLSIIVKFIRSLELTIDEKIQIGSFDKPDESGEVNIFLIGGGLAFRAKLENYIHSDEAFKKRALEIINELDEMSPTIFKVYEKLNELKDILKKI